MDRGGVSHLGTRSRSRRRRKRGRGKTRSRNRSGRWTRSKDRSSSRSRTRIRRRNRSRSRGAVAGAGAGAAYPPESELQRPPDGQVALRGDAHHKESLEGHQDILEGVPHVGEEQDEGLVAEVQLQVLGVGDEGD